MAFLPVDFNSRDRRQTFSLGGMFALGGAGFPANVYTGLTLKVSFLYLNAGFNVRKAAGENASLLPTHVARGVAGRSEVRGRWGVAPHLGSFHHETNRPRR
ncbi:hypothetical protein [Archangium sp.]|uniref:hypothetical protein n=1 Tax=Archangium sp. TaxID=1872627 RepID=UPI003899A055